MGKQNITLSLPKDLLRRVKILAARQDTSVSALMEHLLDGAYRSPRGLRAGPPAPDRRTG